MKNVMSLLGSTDLIGNPTNLLRSVGTGFKSLASETKSGGTFGVAKGTAGLARNTLAGVGGTVSRFTRAVN